MSLRNPWSLDPDGCNDPRDADLVDPYLDEDERKVEPLTPPNPSGPVQRPKPRTKRVRKEG